jgi:hypothetical protein
MVWILTRSWSELVKPYGTVPIHFKCFESLKYKKTSLPRVQGFIGLKLRKLCIRLGLALLSYVAPKRKKNSLYIGMVTDPDST